MIVLSLLVVWMLSGFFFSDPKNNTEISIAIDSEKNIINVKAKQFSSELRLSSVAIQGRTEANRSVLISSETNGIVENILSNKGDQVKKGQIICKLSVDSRKAKLDEAEALMRQKELEWEASKVLVEKGYRSQTKAAGSKAAFDASKALDTFPEMAIIGEITVDVTLVRMRLNRSERTAERFCVKNS